MDYDWLGWVCLLPFVLWAVVVVVAAGICLWEKSPVRPFGMIDPAAKLPPTAYTNDATDAAEAAGYEYVGAAVDPRGGMYRIGYGFWTSPDRDVTVCLASGRVGPLPHHFTHFFSVLLDGRYLLTTDDTAQFGLSGIAVVQSWGLATFAQLHDRHQTRLPELCSGDRPAAVTDPAAALVEARERVADWLVTRGLARYTDDDRTAYRCTLRGAVWAAVRAMVGNTLVGLARSLGLRR